jgi:hypothetical protein
MSEFSIEWNFWPVLIFDLRAEMTADVMDRQMAAVGEALARQKPFAYAFVSVTRSYKFDRQLLRPVADFTNAHRKELGQYCLGAAIVLGSPASRFILTSFLLLARTANPIKAFGSLEPAREWLETILSGAGLEAPPGLAQRLTSKP